MSGTLGLNQALPTGSGASHRRDLFRTILKLVIVYPRPHPIWYDPAFRFGARTCLYGYVLIEFQHWRHRTWRPTIRVRFIAFSSGTVVRDT